MNKIKKLSIGKSKRFKIIAALLAVASITAFVWGATRFQPDREQSGAQANACANTYCDADVWITIQGLNSAADARLYSYPYSFGTCNDPNPERPQYNFYNPNTDISGNLIRCRGFQFGPPDGVYLRATNALTGYNTNFLKGNNSILLDQNQNLLFGNTGLDCTFGDRCKFNFHGGEAYVTINYTLKTPPTPTLSIVSSTQTSINLSWTAVNPAQATVRYNVYRNNSLIASNLNTTSFSNTGLSCNQSYSYKVVAVATGQFGGSSSAESTPKTGSTSACPSSPPPSGGSTGGSSGGGSSGGGSTTPPPSSGGGSSSGGSSSGGSVPSSVGSRRITPPSSSSSGNNTAAVLSDSTAPSTPNGFSATSNLGDVGVNLSWQSATDNVGVAGYKLERSDDGGKTWNIIGSAIVGTSSVDADTKFNTHYDYRLSAFDAAGNYSGFASASVDTAGFQPNAGPNQEVTLTSEDNIVTVTIPTGALAEEAVCSIEIDSNLGESPDVADYVLAAGPYQVVCKNKDGINITSFNEPIRVSIDTSSFNKYDDLAYYSRQIGTGQWENISEVTHDSGSKTDSFELKESTTFAIMGKPHKTSFWIKLLWILLILVIIGVGVYFFIRWRKKRVAEQMYDDYYRKSQGL
jgi:hypothetical protein